MLCLPLRPGLTGHIGRTHHAAVNDDDRQQQGSGISWLLAWLIFGLLAAREVGALAVRAGGDWGALLSLAFLVGSVGCLSVLLAGATRNARPTRALAPTLVSLLALLGCLWALYGPGEPTGSITTLLFGLAYSTLCLVAGLVSLAVARHRYRANEARIADARAEHERRRRMDGVRAETSALMAAATVRTDDDDPLGPEGDFVLPSRPKWEES
jgi:hypothetical protein